MLLILCQNLMTSVLALSRKILLSLHIDTALAVSCLSTVPYDAMVKELRAAVPSIQSDFSRLQTVAKIGENLADMWDQEELLLVFQTLQTNAKWWHTLVAHGVKVDPRTFQSSVSAQRESAIRAVVPALLEKTHGNLSLAMDYCSQFDLEACYASQCYIQNTLLQPPCGVNAGRFDWASQIRSVAATVDEGMVMTTFRKLVRKIHALDYEKIRFVCTWLLEVLDEEDEEEVAATDRDTDTDKDREEEQLGAVSVCLEECQKYLEIATFLSSLTCPTPIAAVTPALQPLYQHLPAEYLTRLPLWGLLDDPWMLLSPLLLQLPDFATKLVPLCSLLGLERDDFYAKRAMNFYSESLKAFTATTVTTGATLSLSHGSVTAAAGSSSSLGKEHPIHTVHEIIGNMKSLVRRVSVWQWIYEHEMTHNVENSGSGLDSDQATIKALQAALDEIAASGQSAASTTEEEEEEEEETATIRRLHAEILLELVKHNCLCSLRTLDEQHTGRHQSESSTLAVLVRHVGKVEDLLRSLFQVAIEQAWLLQLRSLRATQLVLCSHAVMSQGHTPAVKQYLTAVQRVVADVFSFHSQLTHSDPSDTATPASSTSPSSSSSSSTAGKSQLEATRHSYIGNLLTDVEYGQPQQGAGEGDKGVLLWGGEGLGTGGTGEGGDWSDVTPSAAEQRRREDVLRAFGISVLVACTGDEATR